MTAQQVLDSLTARGFHLCTDGQTIWVSPSETVTPDVAEAVRRVRPELLALLERRRACEALAATYRLTRSEQRTSRSVPWSDDAIERYSARLVDLIRLGFHAIQADDLAERLYVRDENEGDTRMCVECAHLGGDRTTAWRCRVPPALRLTEQRVTTLRRCPGFERREAAGG